LGTTPMNQNSIQEEIKSRLKSGNAGFHSMWHILTSSLLSRIIKVKIYRTAVLSVVLYGCETWLKIIKKKWLPVYHCLHTLETVMHVIRLWKGNRGTILMTQENVFYETTNLFPWKKFLCWQETNVTFYHTGKGENGINISTLTNWYSFCLTLKTTQREVI
jgi:hypothetical protein